MISSAFKMLIVKLLGEGQCGLVVYHSHFQLLILSRCCSSCMNLQDLLICLTGAWAATAQKDQDGRHNVRFFIAFPCAPDECLHSFSSHGWSSAKSWALGGLFAIQLFRQAGNAQNASVFLDLHFPFGWMHVGYQAGSPVPRRQRGGWHAAVRDLLTPGSASHHLGLSSPRFGHTKGHVRHFGATWGMEDVLSNLK